jgi:hypothetical protein
MRWIAVCLFSLFVITLAAPSADASSRRPEARAGKVVKPVQASSARTASRQVAAPQRATARTAGRTPARPQATARQVTSRVARPATRQQQQAAARNDNRRVAKATGNTSHGTAMAQRSGMTAGGARLTSWQSGLPMASGEQRDCPAGTMSTLARGHDDIVRCMPL